MDKNSEIKFVGQPIFKQIIDLVDKVNIKSIIKEYDSDRYYKAFKTKTHLITMLFGILSRCDSMTETCEGLRALGGVKSSGIGKCSFQEYCQRWIKEPGQSVL